MIKKISIILLLLTAVAAQAVHLSSNGQGQINLIPYYSVNNALNTLVEVTNNTDQGKVIKVNIREGQHGYAVLSYNVYLDAHDVWTFALISSVSSVPGYEGQATAVHVTSDQSCAPLLNKAWQEFLLYDFIDGPQEISRAREGFIEIIELGSIVAGDALAEAVNMGDIGAPASCATVADFWEPSGNGDITWSGPDLTAATGGLSAEAAVVNVAEGINFPIPTVTLTEFWAEEEWRHANPGDTSLSLDAANPEAFIFNQGRGHQLTFERGIDAVSAVLMADRIYAKYDVSPEINGQTELVLTLPTRRFYFEQSISDPPFNLNSANVTECAENFYGGTNMLIENYDRESMQLVDPFNGGIVTPPTIYPSICGSTFVISSIHVLETPRIPYITESENYLSIGSLPMQEATNSGYLDLGFRETQPLVATDTNSNQTYELYGLPVLGFTLQQYTNVSAQAGLLAQYGGSQAVQVKRVIAVVNESE